MTDDLDQAVDDAIYGPEMDFDYDEDPSAIDTSDRTRAEWHVAAAARIKARNAIEAEPIVAAIVRLEAELERVSAIHAEMSIAADNKIAWHLNAVEAWHRAARAADPKTPKTIKFTHGNSVLRRPGIKLVPPADQAGHDTVRAVLAEYVDPETGETMEDVVYRKVEKTDFMVSELKSRVEIHPEDAGQEPGSKGRVVLVGVTDDEGRPVVLDGVTYTFPAETFHPSV